MAISMGGNGLTEFLCVLPVFDVPETDGIRFQWETHFPLPFPFPLDHCVSMEMHNGNWHFRTSISNHIDRVIICSNAPAQTPSVLLVKRGEPNPRVPSEYSLKRTELTGAFVFYDTRLYATPSEAFDQSKEKLDSCFEWMSQYLLRCQANAPFEYSGVIYPISKYDLGGAYMSVFQTDALGKSRKLLATASAGIPARSLKEPMFHLELPREDSAPDPLTGTVFEVISEAGHSLCRCAYRLCVISSYGAVELLANNVFREMLFQKLRRNGKVETTASTEAEEQRKKIRTRIKDLIHKGLFDVSGRSLFKEEPELYDTLLKIEELRHQTAHAGRIPSYAEASQAYHTCCAVLNWLLPLVGRSPKKPVLRSSGQQTLSFRLGDNF